MKIQALPIEDGINVAKIGKKIAFRMTDFRCLFPKLSREEVGVVLRQFRKEHPKCGYFVPNGELKQWGWYLFEDYQNEFEAFARDPERVKEAAKGTGVAIGYGAATRNINRDCRIVVNFRDQEETISPKNITRAKEIIDLLSEENADLRARIAILSSPKPRIRIAASTARAA